MAKARKTNHQRWSPVASMRDLPTIAFFRAGVLLRRDVPVPGILATHRPGAIMDKSGRQFLGRFGLARRQQLRILKHQQNSNSVTYVLNQKCYLCPDCAGRTPNPER